jgi:hypothetical protein
MIYPAITIQQPYATLSALGAKRNETRSWPAPRKYIGQRIAIHAGKTFFPFMPGYCGDNFLDALADALGMHRRYDTETEADFLRRLHERDLPLGAVVATAILADCYLIGADTVGTYISLRSDEGENYLKFAYLKDTKELLFGDWQPGRYAWRFADMQTLPRPIPARGKQGLWTWEADIA